MEITKRSTEDVDDLLNEVQDFIERGTTKFSGMTYEQGVEAAIRWLRGDCDDRPMDD